AIGTSLNLAAGTTFDMSGDGAGGTATLTGGLALASTNLKFDLGTIAGPSTVRDQLIASGAASLSGNNVISITGFGTNVITGQSPGITTQYALITAASGLNTGGTFSLSNTTLIQNGQAYSLSLTNSPTTETLNVMVLGVAAAWNGSASADWSNSANWTP